VQTSADDSVRRTARATTWGVRFAAAVAASSFGQAFATAFCAIGACCQREGYAFTSSSRRPSRLTWIRWVLRAMRYRRVQAGDELRRRVRAPPKLGEACAYTCEQDAFGSGCSGASGTTTPQSMAGCYQNDGLYCTNACVCAPLAKVGQSCSEYVRAVDSGVRGRARAAV
jgi:hypothetical protein